MGPALRRSARHRRYDGEGLEASRAGDPSLASHPPGRSSGRTDGRGPRADPEGRAVANGRADDSPHGAGKRHQATARRACSSQKNAGTEGGELITQNTPHGASPTVGAPLSRATVAAGASPWEHSSPAPSISGRGRAPWKLFATADRAGPVHPCLLARTLPTRGSRSEVAFSFQTEPAGVVSAASGQLSDSR